MLLDKCHFFRVLPINISTRLIDMSDQSFNRNCHIIKLVSFSNESIILLTILLFSWCSSSIIDVRDFDDDFV